MVQLQICKFVFYTTKTQIKDLEWEAERFLQRSIRRTGPEQTFARFGLMPRGSRSQRFDLDFNAASAVHDSSRAAQRMNADSGEDRV